MRTLLVALGVLALAGAATLNNTAKAGGAGSTYVCWTATGGYTDCDWLPRHYHVPGVRHAHCCNVRHDSDRVEFVLTRGAHPRTCCAGRAHGYDGTRRLGAAAGRLPQASPLSRQCSARDDRPARLVNASRRCRRR